MFLSELKKGESIAFINLVQQFANIDNVLAKEEEELINDYLEELGIGKDEIGNLDYDGIIEVLKTATNRNKSIIYFELVGLALVDGEYGDSEIDYLDKIAYDLDIRRDRKIAFANYFCNFKEIYDFSVVESDSKIELLKEQAEALL